MLNPPVNGKIQGLFNAFECFPSTFQGNFNFQGLFNTVLYIQVFFKHVRTLLQPFISLSLKLPTLPQIFLLSKVLCVNSHLFQNLLRPIEIENKSCDFQQCGILTSVDSDEPVQPPFKLRNSK